MTAVVLWLGSKSNTCTRPFCSAVVPTQSNLRRIQEDGTYISAMDPDYSQMADGVSRLGVGNGMEDNDDDILTYDTHTIGY